MTTRETRSQRDRRLRSNHPHKSMSLVSSPSPAVCVVDRSLESKSPLPAESLETPEETRQRKRERDPSPLSRAVVAGADDVASRQRRSSTSASIGAGHSNHPNRRVKRSADVDIPEGRDSIIRRSSSVPAGGWFGQRDQGRHIHLYSNVNRILLLPRSTLLRSPSTPWRLLILPGLPNTIPSTIE